MDLLTFLIHKLTAEGETLRHYCWSYIATLIQQLNITFFIMLQCLTDILPSVLWRCWLGGRKGIRPVKNWMVRCWRGYLSGTRCRLVYAQLVPLPLSVSCFSKIQIGFTFLVPAHPGSPWIRAVKRVCVCVCLTDIIAGRTKCWYSVYWEVNFYPCLIA